jgi:Flp pilus assembly protein TadD
MTELQPEFIDAWIRRGRSLHQAGNNQDALSSFKRALEIDPSHKEIWNDIGAILDQLGKHEEARICYSKAK